MLILNIFLNIPFSRVSIVDFEQVSVSWAAHDRLRLPLGNTGN